MQKRVGQIVILLLLLVTAGAGYFLFTLNQQFTQLNTSYEDVTVRLFRIASTVSSIGQSEHSYIAPGQTDGPWLARTATLAAQLSEDLRGLRARLSAHAVDAFGALAMSCDALIEADNRIRQNLQLGQPLMAADVLFSDSRNVLDVLPARIGDVRAAEAGSYQAQSSVLLREIWMTVGGLGVAWIAVALIFGFAVSRAARPAPVVPEEPIAPPAEVAANLAEVATLCGDVARTATTTALPSLLKRAAALLDATGVILWMSAGEQLFAVTGHGYDSRLLPRLGPVPRNADNAAARAWRTGQIVIMSPGTTGPGALVAPMFNSQGCFGVLAFELQADARPGTSVEPVAALIAAQFAAAVAAWPAASQPHEVLDLGLDQRDAIRPPA